MRCAASSLRTLSASLGIIGDITPLWLNTSTVSPRWVSAISSSAFANRLTTA
jgi:hypothetical protein